MLAAPRSLDEAVAALCAHPAALPWAGGTDLMPAVARGRVAPSGVVVLGGVRELAGWHSEPLGVWLGAGLTFAELARDPLAGRVAALSRAVRMISAPQLRNAATLGGNLGTAAPDGDTLPVLAALDALVLAHGPAGPRRLSVAEFLPGRGRTALRAGELVAGVWVPAVRGPQRFWAFRPPGSRTVASVALVVDLDARRVRCAVGAVHPVPVRAGAAEAFAAEHLDWASLRTADEAAFEEFGRLVGTTVDGRVEVSRVTAVGARRALARALADTPPGGAA